MELFNALTPVESELSEKIVRTPFAKLTYMWRHKRNASPVPLSYWKYNRSDRESYTAHLPKDIPHSTVPEIIFSQYALNSIFVIGNPDSPSEIEYYYEHVKYPRAYIRLLTIFSNIAPKIGDQFCYSENLMVGGHSLNYAYLTKEFGPHEAIWGQDKIHLLLVKPMIWTTREWFLENMKTFLLQ